MLQTYEAVLHYGQFLWVDAAPTLAKAQLWVTVQPILAADEELPVVTSKPTGMIALLASRPVDVAGVGFLTREQANERYDFNRCQYFSVRFLHT
jgi:hypothetical protein